MTEGVVRIADEVGAERDVALFDRVERTRAPVENGYHVPGGELDEILGLRRGYRLARRAGSLGQGLGRSRGEQGGSCPGAQTFQRITS